ncbi:hypothetical protein E2562_038141 [Oryza meyeriana var. granulata]|uniref:Uncharacterized protein n=1 Tax=Oryza meyeriana var. granulata TaxID=110450 RepID=A0A6G1BQ77_9ORYZ|nr:hypothetical protein E2562_038141 [Oryza meyeriana var. granulata]
MENDQITSEYYLAEHTPLPPEHAEVVEEAESNVVSHGTRRAREEVEEEAESSAPPIEEVEDGGTALEEVEAAAAHVAGEAGDRVDGAAVLEEVEAAAARVVAKAMAMHQQRSGHGWSRY